MIKVQRLALLGLVAWLATAAAANAQTRPYIGYVYPAGGQQGTTFPVTLGGQNMDGVSGVVVNGDGVTVRIVEYLRKLGPQEMRVLSEQLAELKRATSAKKPAKGAEAASAESAEKAGAEPSAAEKAQLADQIAAKIEKRKRHYVNRPANASISTLVELEVTVAADAKPGQRELRLTTDRGVSNPLVFHVGQVPELSRKPMITAEMQVLGKEEQALRNRPDNEVEDSIQLPCTLNGQIASGEVNRYRFEARKGQRLVISTDARELIPYLADAVPGWFQPVLALYDAKGKEVAHDDDYRFKPDPVIFFEVPQDGQYVIAIADALYRGREDFIYRVTIGELPFLTGIFPLGGPAGKPAKIKLSGWNVAGAKLTPPAKDTPPGVYPLTARKGGLVSNAVPFALDTLPECLEKEPNNDPAHAQQVTLPIIVNGRINRPDDWDVFSFSAHAGETVVAEVYARRLDSPLDSLLKLTDSTGKVLAFNDDHEDVGSGLNTHHADSYLMVKLPADGTYCIHLGDTARHGGDEYGYRLRISAPQPDFALRVVPSSLSMRSNGSGTLSVYCIRKDGFTGPIQLGLKDPPSGFSAAAVTLAAGQSMARLNVKAGQVKSPQQVCLVVEGRAKIAERDVARQAVPAEDRMQAFLWRHLVPAQDLEGLVFNPSSEPTSKRVRASKPTTTVATASSSTEKSKFTKGQVAGRLRQLKLLFDEGLLTEEFYDQKVAECEADR